MDKNKDVFKQYEDAMVNAKVLALRTVLAGRRNISIKELSNLVRDQELERATIGQVLFEQSSASAILPKSSGSKSNVKSHRDSQQSIKILTADEVAAMLHINRKTVYEAVRRDSIPHRRIGRRLIFEHEAVLSWLRRDRRMDSENPSTVEGSGYSGKPESGVYSSYEEKILRFLWLADEWCPFGDVMAFCGGNELETRIGLNRLIEAGQVDYRGRGVAEYRTIKGP